MNRVKGFVEGSDDESVSKAVAIRKKEVENCKKQLEYYQKVYSQKEKRLGREPVDESKLKESKIKVKVLQKEYHALEVQLNRSKEEMDTSTNITTDSGFGSGEEYQAVSNYNELKVWNEKIRRKKEILEGIEKDIKKREKAKEINEKNTELKSKLEVSRAMNKPKVTAAEMKKVREAIEAEKRSSKIVIKKNKDKYREKENEVLQAKHQLNLLTTQLGEINKMFRVSQYRESQYARTLKYNLYDRARGNSESQLNISNSRGNVRGPGNYHQYANRGRKERSVANMRGSNQKFDRYMNNRMKSNMRGELVYFCKSQNMK